MYLDHNATTPVDPQVLEAMLPHLQGCCGNPSSVHKAGRIARAAVDEAREQVASLVGVQASQVVFTASGTEANNMALKGVAALKGRDAALLVSAIEHPSVAQVASALARQGWPVQRVAPDVHGLVQAEAVAEAMPAACGLVSVMLANNETGAIQDVAAIARIARARGALVHTDAVQALGKMPVDFGALGVHMMSLSAHKIYGPKGVGALVLDKRTALEPLLHGGGHERRRRAGTENVAAIVGFGKAAVLAQERLDADMAQQSALRDRLIQAARAAVPDMVVFAEDAPRLCNTVALGVPGIEGETLLMSLDLMDIMVSSGSACSSGSLDPSPALLAMGVPVDVARSAIRVSLGRDTSVADIDRFVSVLRQQVERLRNLSRIAG
ncbi:cysteine desulfurase family protein [Thermithiobacillus plumbiphilus]|uniref:cysteine desulfurase n=1 Tax=Thermithiobacillus plumbiphilus TaxID=1729899 RepID=A0ABU9DDY8_9PROT